VREFNCHKMDIYNFFFLKGHATFERQFTLRYVRRFLTQLMTVGSCVVYFFAILIAS